MMWATGRAKYTYLSTFTVKSQRETLSEVGQSHLISGPENTDLTGEKRANPSVPTSQIQPFAVHRWRNTREM